MEGGRSAPTAPRFRHERAVELLSGTAHRLDIDVALLAGSKPFAVTSRDERRIATGGLDDLRMHDASGREVPYLLVPPPVTDASWQPARVLPIAQTEKTSGFEADLGEHVAVEPFISRGFARRSESLVLEGRANRER